MKFNINKYDNITFSKDELTHKRIKALLLWFEHEVYKRDIPLSSQIPMMTDWLKKLKEQGYYEVLPYFSKKLDNMVGEHESTKFNSIVVKNTEKTDKVTVEVVKEPFLIRLKKKIIKLWVDF